jgi:hypothetical protein
MLKIVVNEFGPPEALEAVEAEAPEQLALTSSSGRRRSV